MNIRCDCCGHMGPLKDATIDHAEEVTCAFCAFEQDAEVWRVQDANVRRVQEIVSSCGGLLLLIVVALGVLAGWRLYPNLRDALTAGVLLALGYFILARCFERVDG